MYAYLKYNFLTYLLTSFLEKVCLMSEAIRKLVHNFADNNLCNHCISLILNHSIIYNHIVLVLFK